MEAGSPFRVRLTRNIVPMPGMVWKKGKVVDVEISWQYKDMGQMPYLKIKGFPRTLTGNDWEAIIDDDEINRMVRETKEQMG